MVVELPYSLHTRYASIAVAWTIILIPPIFINLGLFYGLWYGKPELDRILVLTIPTAVLGVFTVIGIVERVWKLVRPSPEFRPLKSPRHALDIFQWGYFASLLLISALITSTLAWAGADPEDNNSYELQIRLLSLPTAVLTFFLATLTLLTLVLNAVGFRPPFRFGSSDAGAAVLKPAVYYIVEDVVAVDGNGGLEYRRALVARYDSSPRFRRMIWSLSLAWMAFFYGLAAVFAVLVFRLPVVAVYAVGWAGPFPLAALMALGTIFYVRSCLREEREMEQEGEREPLLRE